MNPGELRAFLVSEAAKYADLLRKAGVKAD
jgi:hypothetical protein